MTFSDPRKTISQKKEGKKARPTFFAGWIDDLAVYKYRGFFFTDVSPRILA